MKLSHFSDKVVTSVRSVAQKWRYNAPSEHEKPKGFWVSVDGDDDWASWCEVEQFGIGKIRHKVELTCDANILKCECANDLDCLTERYSMEVPGYSWRNLAIDWDRIAREYQGIIIAPYVWSRRLHDDYSWYYSWDCASGCIWDSSAIANIEPTEWNAPMPELCTSVPNTGIG